MSSLDQAVIKAYAKGRAMVPPVATETSSRPIPAAAAGARAQAIDQIYHEGVLYRVEGQPATAQRREQSVPAPHLSMLPPTSPRRAVRRSMLRMLSAERQGGHSLPDSGDSAVEGPPRIARKVIFRHISHGAAPPPLGILRPSRAGEAGQAELPPETITNEPSPASPPDPSPLAPQIVPLNVAIEVCGDWDHEAAVAPMVLVADVQPSEATSLVVNVQVESLDADDQADAVPASFAVKSLDDREEPRAQIRIDAPHAHDFHRPHSRFVKSAGAALDAKAARADELTFAEAPVEALASDLIPATGDEAGATATAAVDVVKAAVPQWEIDKFHWPRTCEKLFADEQGYLAKAGDKLQAAMQDGLKVLAVTGSRRGEGRSTLALCLARAAAKAGIQTAVMDADFARPQLASKVGLEIAHGWQEAALGTIPLSEAAVKSIADQITLLPLESSSATRSLSLADPRVTATIRAAAATFELLILDLGPLGAGVEIAFPPGERCPLDAAIVVRDLRFATVAESEAIGHALQDTGVEAVGIAENFVIDDE
jgi:Mrp family chromosome partitioning ATPase